MIIIGYRSNVNRAAGIKAVQKHTGKEVKEARLMIDEAMRGVVVEFDRDWVLREDLEDSGFIID